MLLAVRQLLSSGDAQDIVLNTDHIIWLQQSKSNPNFVYLQLSSNINMTLKIDINSFVQTAAIKDLRQLCS